MGAIARNIANNITTSGVFTSSAITNSSVTGITTLAGISDGITLISSQTASNSASISFTSGLTSTYKAYKFVFADIHGRSDGTVFQFQGSTNGGSSYGVTITSNYFRAYHNEADSAVLLEYVGTFDLAQSTSFQNIASDIGTDADQCCGGSLTLFNPSSTTYTKQFIGNTQNYHNADYSMEAFSSGYFNTTSAINAIRFQMASGNFDGTIYLYGIK
jgi:hypothetical protein